MLKRPSIQRYTRPIALALVLLAGLGVCTGYGADRIGGIALLTRAHAEVAAHSRSATGGVISPLNSAIHLPFLSAPPAAIGVTRTPTATAVSLTLTPTAAVTVSPTSRQ